MAIILSTDFNSPNAIGWPAPWTTYEGSTEINANRGRITTAAAAWDNASAQANLTFTDGLLSGLTNTPNINNGTSNIDFRYNPSTGSGYRISFGWYYGGLELLTVNNWSPTSIASVTSLVWSPNTDYRFKLEVIGNTVRCKVWLSASEEPATWQIDHSDNTFSTGDILLRSTSRETANSMVGNWDDILLTDPITLEDTESPTVTLSDPTPNGLTPGYEHVYGTVALHANASDDMGISQVDFYDGNPGAGGVLIGSATALEYETNWNTVVTSNGPHQLYVVATDTAGKSTTSAPVAVMVNNSGVWTPKNGRAWPVTISN